MKKISVKNACLYSVFIFIIGLDRFFSEWRHIAFRTSPGDDYTPNLNYLLNISSVDLSAPFGYRLLGLFPALLWKHFLPLIEFSNHAKVTGFDAQAWQAICFNEYVFSVLATLITFLLSIKYTNFDIRSSIASSLLFFVLLSYFPMNGVDNVSMFFECLFVYCFFNMPVFALLACTMPFVNEKISFAIFFFSAISMFVSTDTMKARIFRIGFGTTGLLIYVFYRLIWHLPGNENQTQLSSFLESGLATLKENFSVKGAYLTLMPIIILGSLWLSCRNVQEERERRLWQSCIFMLPCFAFLGCVADVRLNLGRICLYSLPFFFPIVALKLSELRGYDKSG